jgi:hypothetical protein
VLSVRLLYGPVVFIPDLLQFVSCVMITIVYHYVFMLSDVVYVTCIICVYFTCLFCLFEVWVGYVAVFLVILCFLYLSWCVGAAVLLVQCFQCCVFICVVCLEVVFTDFIYVVFL